eukprot:6322610-Prorocentrum_lima.AAC.1
MVPSGRSMLGPPPGLSDGSQGALDGSQGALVGYLSKETEKSVRQERAWKRSLLRDRMALE